MDDCYCVDNYLYTEDGLNIELILRNSGLSRPDGRSDWLYYLARICNANSSWHFLNDTERVMARIRECPCPLLAAWRLESIVAACIYDPANNVCIDACNRYQRFLESVLETRCVNVDINW